MNYDISPYLTGFIFISMTTYTDDKSLGKFYQTLKPSIEVRFVILVFIIILIFICHFAELWFGV